MPRQQPAVESIEPVDTLPKISNTTKNSPEAKRTIEKTKERLTPLKAEKISIDIFKTAELDYDKSFLLVAKKLGLKNHNVYDLKFQQKLIERQKELGLKPDGILGVVTLSSILLEDIIFKGGDVFIELSTNKELKKFNKDIEKGTVTDEQLKKYENQLKGKFDLFLEGVEKKNLGKANDFLTKNYTTIQILYLMAKFDKQNKNNPKYKAHFNRMDKLKKEYKNNPTINKILNDPMTVMSSLKISPEQAKRLGITLSQDGTIAPAEHQKGGNLISVMLDKNKTWSEKLQALSGSALGWLGIIILVWNKFGFKGIMIGIAGLVAGAADGITPKSLAKMLGEQLDKGISEDSKAKGAAAVAATTEALTKVSNKVKESGVNLVDYTKNLFTKNNNIVETAMSENNKLDKNKLMTISKELGGDDKFKEIKIEKLSSLKYNDLDKTTKKILKEKGIEGDTKEFKAYIKTLKEKIVKARKKDKSIQTVGDYFDKWNITADQISMATGAGMMGLSLITKSPTTFFIGASAVGAGLAGAWEKFFGSETYKNIESKTKNIVENATVLMNNKIDNTLKGNDKLIQNVKTILNKEKLDNNDFEAIKKLGDSNPTYKSKLEKLSKDLEKDYYETQVKVFEDSDIIPEFIKNIYNTAEEYKTELTDSFDKKKEQINLSIKQIEELKDKINKSGLEASQKNLLIAQLDAQIAKAKAQINLVESQKEKSKLKNENKLKNEISKLKEYKSKLEKENKKLDSNNPEQNVKIQENKIKILKLEQQIKQKQAELTKATAIVSKIQTEQIEKEENITRLKNSVKNIKDFSTKNLDEIYLNINKLKEGKEFVEKTEKEYRGTEEKIKTLISNGEKNIDTLKKHINSFANTILGEIKADNLSNYPDEEISKYKEILEKLDIKSDDFITALKTKKKEIFNVKISSANIEEIQVLRKNFKNAGIENFDNKIEERSNLLAKENLVKNNKELTKTINNLKPSDYLTQNVIDKIKTFSTVYELYKYIYDTLELKSVKNIIEKKYGKLKIEEKNNKIVNTTSNNTKNSINTNSRANRGKETNEQKNQPKEENIDEVKTKVKISPDDIFKS